jgi:hypothetical protein
MNARNRKQDECWKFSGNLRSSAFSVKIWLYDFCLFGFVFCAGAKNAGPCTY